ncbi:MAG: septum formation initiator family protein [Rubrimonas sp.]
MQQQTWRFPLMDAAFCFAILAGVANFGWHALRGDYGVLASMAIEAEERELRIDLAELTAERARLENVAMRLGPAALDLDLLDETARAVLGLARADEVIPH